MKQYPDASNCTIEDIAYYYNCLGENKVGIKAVTHKQTHQVLHAVSLAEACRMAALLDLEARVCQWYSEGVVPEAEDEQD